MTKHPTHQHFSSLPLEWIAVKNLSVVWIAAQRPLDKKWAQFIADNFDPELFDPLLVTSKDGNGMYHVVKGQHRKVGVQSLWGDDEEVPCFIAPIDDPARAAELLVLSNKNVKKMHGVHEFLISVTAKFPDHVAVARIVKDTGYKVSIGAADGNITAVAALLWVYRNFGHKILRDTLIAMRETFGFDHSAANAHIIKSYGSFLTECPKADVGRLATAVSGKYTAGQLLTAGRAEADALRVPVIEGMKRILLKAYNKGLKSGKLEIK